MAPDRSDPDRPRPSASWLARRMTGAQILGLRRNRGTLLWTLFLGAGTMIIYYAYTALDHASDPVHHGPAGGVAGFARGLQGLAIFVGPLAAAMVGAEAGAGDIATGVFRDLVATGRSRLAIFLVRIPAALIVTLSCVVVGFVIALGAAFILAGGTATPDLGLVTGGLGWVLLADGLVCVLAVGLGAVTGSRAITLTTIIGWELVVSPQLVSAASLGSARKFLLDGALLRIEPHPVPNGTPILSMSVALAVIVMLAWPAVAVVAGARRASRRDA